MSPLRYSVFALGGLASFAAAAAGIIIYASHPGSNFYLIGWDELQHREFAQLLLHGGSGSIFANMLEGQALTGDATWGTGLLIGLCVYCFGTDVSYIALKWVLHVLAALLLYRLVRKYRGERVAGYAAFFFLIYPPLLLYGASFLKDDLVAALVIITAASIDRKWYLAAAPLMLLMIAVRANAVLFPVILLGYLRHARLRYVLLLSALPVAVVVSLLPGYVQAMLNVLHLPPTTVLFFVVKYLLGPLPGNLLSYQSEAAWILPWYTLSFLGILGGCLLPGFYSSIRRNWKWIALLLAVCLGPYLPYVQDADVVGPRQFAAVGWLFFLLCYERLLRYGFTLEREPRRASAEAGWSAAT
jgi:hypothetical protein